MPELPDVEATKKYLEKRVLNKPVRRVEVDDARIIRGTDFRVLQKGVEDNSFTAISRRGKYLLFKTAKGTMLVHRGLTGDLTVQSKDEPAPRFTHATFYMDGSALYYKDQRKFGKIAFYETKNWQEIPELAKLGPEPLDKNFDYRQFKEILERHATDIHKVLMMQEEIAGIGNEYADEICFQASVKPDRNADSLSRAEVKTLFDSMKTVLAKAVELNANLAPVASTYIIPHRHTDRICPWDGTRLQSKRVGGRTSYFCPKHQK